MPKTSKVKNTNFVYKINNKLYCLHAFSDVIGNCGKRVHRTHLIVKVHMKMKNVYI